MIKKKQPLQQLLNEPLEVKELSLIGRRNLRSNNSWLHNSLRMVKGPNKCTLLMHPEDALKRGIDDGDQVKVKTRIGEEQVEVKFDENIMRGVVSMPHGWGHNREGTSLNIANQNRGASLNDLLDETDIDTFSGVVAINGIAVEVYKFQEIVA